LPLLIAIAEPGWPASVPGNGAGASLRDVPDRRHGHRARTPHNVILGGTCACWSRQRNSSCGSTTGEGPAAPGSVLGTIRHRDGRRGSSAHPGIRPRPRQRPPLLQPPRTPRGDVPASSSTTAWNKGPRADRHRQNRQPISMPSRPLQQPKTIPACWRAESSRAGRRPVGALTGTRMFRPAQALEQLLDPYPASGTSGADPAANRFITAGAAQDGASMEKTLDAALEAHQPTATARAFSG